MAERRLIHADLHGDHLFVDGGRLSGIIDWGDAFATDPYYELPPLHLHSFRADPRLLRRFLDAYGWEVRPDFVRRAMSAALTFEFNVLGELRGPGESSQSIDLAALDTLDDLAQRLWRLE